MDELARQPATCALHGSALAATAPAAMVGLALSTFDGRLPLNGLRHPIEGRASGWYFWAGEEFPLADDAFLPMHAEHLRDHFPEALPYLGLAPGWRFLLAPGYGDVWFDPQLLNV